MQINMSYLKYVPFGLPPSKEIYQENNSPPRKETRIADQLSAPLFSSGRFPQYLLKIDRGYWEICRAYLTVSQFFRKAEQKARKFTKYLHFPQQIAHDNCVALNEIIDVLLSSAEEEMLSSMLKAESDKQRGALMEIIRSSFTKKQYPNIYEAGTDSRMTGTRAFFIAVAHNSVNEVM